MTTPKSILDPNQRSKALAVIMALNPKYSPSEVTSLTDYGLVNQLIIELDNLSVAVEMLKDRLEEEREER